MTIYYKIFEEWAKYPFHQEIERRFCVFSISKKNFSKGEINFTMDSDTSIEQKKEALEAFLNMRNIKVEKIK